MKWTAKFYPIRPLAQAERQLCLPIRFKDLTSGKCDFCDGEKFDNCYNCEKSMCKEHGIPFVMLKAGSGGRLSFVLNVCSECVKDNGLEKEEKVLNDKFTKGHLVEMSCFPEAGPSQVR